MLAVSAARKAVSAVLELAVALAGLPFPFPLLLPLPFALLRAPLSPFTGNLTDQRAQECRAPPPPNRWVAQPSQ